VRNAVGADEVAAGSAVEDGELDASRTRDPVHDLVHRAVAAHDNQKPRSLGNCLAGEFGKVALILGEVRVSLQSSLLREARDLRPALSRRAVVGRRVDEKDGLANGSPR
jgi:hypothetical protein